MILFKIWLNNVGYFILWLREYINLGLVISENNITQFKTIKNLWWFNDNFLQLIYEYQPDSYSVVRNILSNMKSVVIFNVNQNWFKEYWKIKINS